MNPFRWLQSKRERELDSALHYERARTLALEHKITILQDEKAALRQSRQHWEHMYHQATIGTPAEKPG